MLLTVPWCLSIIAGRVNCFNGEYTYKRPASATSEWKRLDPPDRWLKTGFFLAPSLNQGTLYSSSL